MKQEKNKIAIIVFVLLIVAFVAGQIFWSWNQNRQQQKKLAVETQQNEETIRHLVSSEELLLQLGPQLRRLSNSVTNNRQLPDPSATSVFAEQVELSGSITLTDHPTNSELTDDEVGRLSKPWSIEQSDTLAVSRDDLKLWQSVLDEVDHFENARFYFVRGEIDANDANQFNSVIGFNCLAVYQNQRYASLHAEVDAIWTRPASAIAPDESDSDVSAWAIKGWKINDWSSQESSGKYFSEVLESTLDSDEIFSQATRSLHAERNVALLKGIELLLPPGITYPFFMADVTLEHPGLSVVDINNDGFDDLYVAMQYGKNLLFRNKGDGTFEEVASEYGLDLPADSTSAIFADFDNDGDPDLFLGRARQPALYLVNEDGRFVDAADRLIGFRLPPLVSSISAADYNGDGLLDLYLCTYSPIEPGDVSAQKTPVWVTHFLSSSQADEFAMRNKNSHPFLNRTGPPNMLLKNVGDGKFEQSELSPGLELWRMTFQAAWHDFDSDGDPDLYVSNDYGSDNFMRNDGEEGFTDLTKEAGLTGMGFGMGVSWGDYDNDGQYDIYVSNMHSKAGDRITSQFSGINPKLREMAAGNFLYRQTSGKFERVSGFNESDLKVAKAGWSWGGQFIDFNNDGFRDIYVVNGYYTAPDEVAVDIDL